MCINRGGGVRTKVFWVYLNGPHYFILFFRLRSRKVQIHKRLLFSKRSRDSNEKSKWRCTKSTIFTRYKYTRTFPTKWWLRVSTENSRKKVRSCQASWFKTFPWLHYDQAKDSVLCSCCIKLHDKLIAEHNKEDAYVTKGFNSWKKAPAANINKLKHIPLPWRMNPLCQNAVILLNWL